MLSIQGRLKNIIFYAHHCPWQTNNFDSDKPSVQQIRFLRLWQQHPIVTHWSPTLNNFVLLSGTICGITTNYGNEYLWRPTWIINSFCGSTTRQTTTSSPILGVWIWLRRTRTWCLNTTKISTTAASTTITCIVGSTSTQITDMGTCCKPCGCRDTTKQSETEIFQCSRTTTDGMIFCLRSRSLFNQSSFSLERAKTLSS